MVKEELRRRKNKKSAESVGLENQLSRKINDNVTDPDPINNSNINLMLLVLIFYHRKFKKLLSKIIHFIMAVSFLIQNFIGL